jgi:ABC-type transporter Mla subunit MlaD
LCSLIFSIQSGEKRTKSNESDIKLFKAQVQEEVDSTKARTTKISKMAQQAKALLNQLKDIRSTKRKILQEIWGFDSETRFYLKEKRAKNKSRAK